MPTPTQLSPLRVVTFNVLPPAFGLIRQWAAQGGHKIVLAVTTPGPSTRRTPSYRGIVNDAPPEIDVLVTTRLRTRALPLIRELQPDLVVSFSFPYRILPEICAIPRYGAVNLHPAALPAYRGPNVMRAIYERYPLLGATAHHIAEDFDTGNILAQKIAPLPENATPEAVGAAWFPLMIEAFAEGVARAVAGEPGTPQDHSQASYAASFTEAEEWLDPHESMRVIQCKATALNLFGAPLAKLRLGDQVYQVARVDPLANAPAGEPGTIRTQSADGFELHVADGVVQVKAAVLG